MSKKQYFSVTSRGLKIITYRSENLNGIIKEIIDDILWSYNLEPDEITSETLDSDYFRELFDFNEEDANSLKKLVEFKESLSKRKIELHKDTNYLGISIFSKICLIISSVVSPSISLSGETITRWRSTA